MPTTYTRIASQEVGAGGAASVIFSSIPQTFNDLMLLGSARGTNSGRTDAKAIVNNTTGGYTYNFMEGYATNQVYSSNSNSTNGIDVIMPDSSHTANYFSTSQHYISNYKSTGYKQGIARQCSPSNSTLTFYIQALAFQITSAAAPVTSLTVTANVGLIAQFSKFHLYGISYT